MKFKTTINKLRNEAVNLRSCGYCDMQWLLRDHEPIAYNSGVDGWNFDVYVIYGLTITTGYRKCVGKSLEHLAEYERKAKEIWESKMTYEEKRRNADTLLKEFCVLNGGWD